MIFTFDNFSFDARRLDLRRDDRALEVDTILLRVLAVLVRNAGYVVTKDQLVTEVWEGRAIAEHVVSATVARLRKALGDQRGEEPIVSTVYGRGYRFSRPMRTVGSTRPPGPGPGVPPFVGREGVLADLNRIHAEVQAGRGRLCVLTGEAGIGKSRAAEAFGSGLPTTTRAFWGSFSGAGDAPPLRTWGRLLREVLAQLSGDEPLQEDPALRPLLADAAAAGIAAGEQAWFQRHQRHLAFEAVVRLLHALSQRAPLVLVLDDLHHADAASLELLLHLLDPLARQRVMLLATMRDPRPPAREAVQARLDAALTHRTCERLPLQRLSELEVRSYVLGMLGTRASELARAVFAKSAGNPFYMAEFVRQILSDGARAREALSTQDPALELVRQHVARLDTESLRVLTAAAVIGRSFELGLLRAITGRDLNVLIDSLDTARAAEVLTGVPDSPTAFAFGHELFRTVLYESLPPEERRAWHARVADVLDKRASGGEPVLPNMVAHHHHAALPGVDPEKTVHYCRLAANAAAASFANDEVVRHLRGALSALDLMEAPSVTQRKEILQLIAAYARGGSAAEYESSARELAQLARATRDASTLVRAGMMFNLHPGFKQLSGAGDDLSHALRLLGPDETALRAAALSGLAVSAPTCFSGERSEALLNEALPLARASASPLAQYAAFVCALQLRGGPDQPRDAEALLDELDKLAHQNPVRMPVLPIDLYLYRAVTGLQRGEANAAVQLARNAALHARRLHHDELAWHAERMQALISLERDPAGPGAAQLQQLHARANDPGLFGVEAFRALDRASWCAELGTASRLTDQELEALRYDASDPPSLWSLKLRALACAGAQSEARAALRAVTAQELDKLPCDRDWLGTLGHVAVAAAQLGAKPHAKSAGERLAKHRDAYAAHVGFLCEGSIPHVLGLVALALGDAERAVRELEEGLERDEHAGLVRCAGYARLELARALRRRAQPGDAERARGLVEQASTCAETLRLRLLARAAKRLSE